MSALGSLEPKSLFGYFEELTQIPHGSGNLQAISDHLTGFARDRDFDVVQDEALNVIIKVPGTAGYEDHAPVILQGHMDMVAVCEEGAGIDMTCDPLKITTDGEWISAEKTSLGGDNGIAVAMCQAILTDDSLQHPPLTVVITTDEETGMDGARALDPELIAGKRMINLDSEDEGVMLAGCAGGGRFHARYLYEQVKRSGVKCEISISGLQGGHSGQMIKAERGNANVLLARLLYELYRKEKIDYSLISVNGGTADNVIPSQSTAVIILPQETEVSALKKAADTVAAKMKAELEIKDPGFWVTITEQGKGTFTCFDSSSMKHAVKLICSLPNGVQAMSAAMEGLVETSLNLGILTTDEKAQTMTLSYSVRSSVTSAKEHLLDRLRMIAKSYGAATEVTGLYPGWTYTTESPLRDTMIRVFEKMYGRTPTVEAIHAGVECGFFAEKIPGIDCVSIGPDMQDIHSVREKLSVSSSRRTYEFVCAVLKEL